jgi:hypothetical protein
MLRRKLQLIIALIFFQATAFYASTVNAEIKFTRESWGTSRNHGAIDEKKYDFRVISVPFSELDKERKALKDWRGIDSYDPPRFAVSNITFQIENTLIKFPVAAFHDLGIPGGPYGMKVEKNGMQILLNLKGGDGAGSYTSIFIIENAKLIERQIKEFTPDGEYNVTETIKFNR